MISNVDFLLYGIHTFFYLIPVEGGEQLTLNNFDEIGT